MIGWHEIYRMGQDDGIELVFSSFQDEIDNNWTGDFRANAQYLVDKVKWLFEEELARAGAKNGRIVGKEN